MNLPWQYSWLAWHSGVNFMVWEHHGVNLQHDVQMEPPVNRQLITLPEQFLSRRCCHRGSWRAWLSWSRRAARGWRMRASRRSRTRTCQKKVSFWQINNVTVDTNLSPNLKLWNCLPIRQANVGPTILPGRGLSVMPADQRSRSSGEAYTLAYPLTL